MNVLPLSDLTTKTNHTHHAAVTKALAQFVLAFLPERLPNPCLGLPFRLPVSRDVFDVVREPFRPTFQCTRNHCCCVKESKKVERGSHVRNLHVHRHNIRLVKCLCTVRTLAHAVLDTRFDTTVAEEVTTSLESGIFEVCVADVAECKSLFSH